LNAARDGFCGRLEPTLVGFLGEARVRHALRFRSQRVAVATLLPAAFGERMR
jgi:hypothetical protein